MLRTAFRSHFSHCSGPRPLGASVVAFCAGISIVLFGAGLSWRRQQENTWRRLRRKRLKPLFMVILRGRNQISSRSFVFSRSGRLDKPTVYGVRHLYIIAAGKRDLRSPSDRMHVKLAIWPVVSPGRNLHRAMLR